MALSENRALAQALGAAAHPLRLDLLEAFVGGLAASPAEAALLVGGTLPNVSHHIQVLCRERFLALAEIEIREGSPHARYQATDRARALVEALTAVR